MTPSPDSTSGSGQPSILSDVYSQISTKPKKLKKGKDKSAASKNELGRRDKNGDSATTLYPREVTSPPNEQNGAPISPTTSPLLSALGSTATAQYTSEWTKSIPFVTDQQPLNNEIDLGGSPPSMPPSTKMMQEYDPKSPKLTPSSASPPIMSARPLSHPNPFTTFGGRLQPSPRQSPGRDRRSSMYAQTGHRSPFSSNPPLPHQPQAHFYGFHGIDLGIQNQPAGGVRPGDEGYYCGFDTLATSGRNASKKTNNVLLVGYEGGFDVYKVERSKMDVIGRLEGLRGSVIGAKIIPSSNRDSYLRHASPLVALIIHGPMIVVPKETPKDDEAELLLDTESTIEPRERTPSDVKEYQTTVEVYSLSKQEHIATLFTCPPVPISSSITSPIFRPPPPTGDLSVNASGNFLTVSSGVSGEVFVFSSYPKPFEGQEVTPEEFRCVGKLWTTVRTRTPGVGSSSSSSVEAISLDGDEHKQHGIPMLSSSGRWLAVVPPASATRLSVNGSALLSANNPNPPGIGHHNAPPQPSENCAVEAPESDGLAGRFAREGTQAAVRGAKWAADTGMQAFQYYFGKPQTQDGSSANAFTSGDPMSQQKFPPTHSQSSFSPTRHDSTLVSIFDLNRFIEHEHSKRKGVHEPIATFSPPHGISHLSFSPSGTMLMTVGKKGDVQEVWNLMRIGTRKSRRTARHTHDGPHVRQVARFTRMTVANVVHVAWTAPHGRGVAILTENGTVHLYPMPSAAFQWPPARSMAKAPKKPAPEEPAAQQNRGRAGAAGAAVTSAFKAINGFSNTFRSASSSDTAKSPNFGLSMASAVGARSSKAVAMNLSKSLGSAAKNFAHAGDNKIHLPSNGTPPAPESIAWLTSRTGRSSLVTLSTTGNIDIYRVFMQPARGKQHPARMRKKRMVQFQVPDIRGGPLPPSMLSKLDTRSGSSAIAQSPPQGLHGNWALRALNREPHPSRAAKQRSIHPLSFAELETSTPFLPFHTDRRVTMLHTLDDALNPQQSPEQHGYTDEDNTGVSLSRATTAAEPTFGAPLTGRRVFAAHPSHHLPDSEDLDDEEFRAQGMQAENRLVKKGGEFEEVQIIVTTRRKRRGGAAGEGGDGMEGEEGFFEDDCEVLDFAEDRV